MTDLNHPGELPVEAEEEKWGSFFGGGGFSRVRFSGTTTLLFGRQGALLGGFASVRPPFVFLGFLISPISTLSHFSHAE